MEVDGRRFQVRIWLPETVPAGAGASDPARRRQSPGRPAAASAAGGTGASGGSVSAPMQGTIVKVLVEVGQAVRSGEPVVVLEAMKMENHVNADSAGTVKEIRVKAGDTVGGGDVLVVLE